MNPDTWRIHEVTPSLVGQFALIEVREGELVKARIEAVDGFKVKAVAFGVQYDVDLSDGKKIWVRVA